ncbi:hypothetical protein A2U01_0020355, partial [Trifolium medium]|nr:hypothetical protein [Trifolium medium]MCH99343.1 hypothetical protein [Trifolium medium]
GNFYKQQHEIRECYEQQRMVQWMIFPSYIEDDQEGNIFLVLECLNHSHGGQSCEVH